MSEFKSYSDFFGGAGQIEYKDPQDVSDAVLAFPGELATDKKYIDALVGGRLQLIPRADAQYELPPTEDSFSALTNLVPIKSTAKGHRVTMGARMLTQSLPLVNPEAPLVQAAMPERRPIARQS
jgi:hypothetical protein